MMPSSTIPTQRRFHERYPESPACVLKPDMKPVRPCSLAHLHAPPPLPPCPPFSNQSECLSLTLLPSAPLSLTSLTSHTNRKSTPEILNPAGSQHSPPTLAIPPPLQKSCNTMKKKLSPASVSDTAAGSPGCFRGGLFEGGAVSHHITSHPIPSHHIPSHPIPSHPFLNRDHDARRGLTGFDTKLA